MNLLQTLVKILSIFGALSALLWAVNAYGMPFIGGVFIGFAIFEFGYWGDNGSLYWFSGRDPWELKHRRDLIKNFIDGKPCD